MIEKDAAKAHLIKCDIENYKAIKTELELTIYPKFKIGEKVLEIREHDILEYLNRTTPLEENIHEVDGYLIKEKPGEGKIVSYFFTDKRYSSPENELISLCNWKKTVQELGTSLFEKKFLDFNSAKYTNFTGYQYPKEFLITLAKTLNKHIYFIEKENSVKCVIEDEEK